MSLHLGNITPRVRTDELERVFRKFGQCSVQVKGKFGFVDYDYPVNAEKALKMLRGKKICGELLTLAWSKSNNQPSSRTVDSYGRKLPSYGQRHDSRIISHNRPYLTNEPRDEDEDGLRRMGSDPRGMERPGKEALTLRSRKDNPGKQYEKVKRVRESQSPEHCAKKSRRPQSSPVHSDSSICSKSANSNFKSRSLSSSSSFSSKSQSIKSRNHGSGSVSRSRSGSRVSLSATSSSGCRSSTPPSLQNGKNDPLIMANSPEQNGTDTNHIQKSEEDTQSDEGKYFSDPLLENGTLNDEILARTSQRETNCDLNVSEFDTSSHKTRTRSMCLTSEEMLMVIKHYGLKQPEEKDLLVESYFGCARLWPWEVLYYRRLKKGSISVENYARRVFQNKEFGIVDKYVRSSSGWGEEEC